MRIPLVLTLAAGAATVWLWQARPPAPAAMAPVPLPPSLEPPLPGADGRLPGVRVEGYPGEDALVLHPLWALDYHSRRVSRLVWPGLARLGADGEPLPVLAAGWRPVAGGRRWEVELRPGLQWSDGAPLTAADVVFTFAALREPGYHGPLAGTFADVVRAEAGDSLRASFTLRRADPHFPARLTPGLLPMHALVSTRAAASQMLDLRRAPAAGPYRLGAPPDGGVAALVQNAASHAPGRWARLVLRPLASPAAAAGALASGAVDAVCLGGVPVPWARAVAALTGVTADWLPADDPHRTGGASRRDLPPDWSARRAGAEAPDCSA